MKKVLQKYWAWAFVVIPLLLQAIFFYVPMFQGAFYSFTNWTGLTYNYKFVGLNNFKLLFMDPKFMNAIGFTAIITIAMVVGEIALGIFIARVLNSKIKGQTFFRAWFFFPAVLSGLTVALIFKQVFNYGLPAIGNALHIEFLQTSLLGTKWGAIFAAVFVLLWQGVAMPIIIFLAGLQSIPSEITEAARIDGATSKQVFWNVELPYLLPSVSMVFILALKGGLTAFDQVFAMTGGGPNNATTSLGLLVYNYAFSTMKQDERKALIGKYILLILGSVLILVPLLATLFSSFKPTKDIVDNFFGFPTNFTWDNFSRLLADGIGGYYWNSVVITVLSLLAVMIFIPMAAYSIARNMSKRKAFTIMYTLLILGIFVPFQVIMIPITVMMSKLGLANTFGLILLYLTYAIPQTLFLYVGYIKISIPESLDEAAEIDGANKFTTYFRIIFPMMKPMHATTMIINALWFWNDFMLPLLVLNRDSKMWTLPLFQYNYAGQYFNDYGPSFASYVVGIISITIVYLFFQRHIIAGMSNGAVK